MALVGPRLSHFIVKQQGTLERLLMANTQIPKSAFGNWAKRMVEAIANEVDGVTGSFLTVLESILVMGDFRPRLIDELQNAVSVLREQFSGVPRQRTVNFESVWNEAREVLWDAATSEQMKNQVAADLTSALFLRRTAAEEPVRLTQDAMVKAITDEFDTIGLKNGLVSVFTGDDRDELECIVAIRDGAPVFLENDRYSVRTIVPPFLERDERMSYVVIPLIKGDERLGIMVLQFGLADIYYEILREHISGYLKNISKAKTG